MCFIFSLNRYLLLLKSKSCLPNSKSTMVRCFCGQMAIVRTAWIDKNPGRRFWGCPKEDSTCGFAGWIDPQISINKLKTEVGKLKEENQMFKYDIGKIKEEKSKLKLYLICSWIWENCYVCECTLLDIQVNALLWLVGNEVICFKHPNILVLLDIAVMGQTVNA
uniref:GRF-type domain-containing protein n=1 Tax=Lactuca sativa TaxID=4236 RepID=A0A9R1V8I6_LACSA|nr:hypothetical protein LSAT_V11C600331790 [Lactuca sativa]